MEAQEVQDGWRCVEYVALGGHHQHKAVESLRDHRKNAESAAPGSLYPPAASHGHYLEQQVALGEADAVDGDRRGGRGGGGRGLAGPAKG